MSIATTPTRANPSRETAHQPEHQPGAVLDVVVPVYNEEGDLESSVRRLNAHLTDQFRYLFRITIADNASTDSTPEIAARLASEPGAVTSVRMPEKGRGRALRAAWSASDAQVASDVSRMYLGNDFPTW
ncbi:MAG TPA: glycosyltransferase [Pseudonocardiaceae bacterium]|nr:glycosyltransferase [Pseudonocardiaceae bacterium]